MANVTINDNRNYVKLGLLSVGDYFIVNGDLCMVREESCNRYFECFNFTHEEEVIDVSTETEVLPIPSNKVKITINF